MVDILYGKVAVEILGEQLKIPLVNYSIGGATSGKFNYSSWLDTLGPTGLLGQVEKFKTDLKRKLADSNALYFIFISANDFYYYMDYNQPGTIRQVADWSISNIVTAIQTLSDLGARHFFIIGSADLSLNPYEIITQRIESAQLFTSYFNSKLAMSLNQLPPARYASLQIFDLAKFNLLIMSKAKLMA